MKGLTKTDYDNTRIYIYIAAFMKEKNSLVGWCREKKKNKRWWKSIFKALAKNFFNIKKFFMADLLTNGLHEKV